MKVRQLLSNKKKKKTLEENLRTQKLNYTAYFFVKKIKNFKNKVISF